MIRLLAAAMLSLVTACAGLRPPTEVDDVSRAAGPPPKHWQAAVNFGLDDSVRVEFFDGVRTRVVTSRESGQGEFGRTPWYRLHVRDILTTELRVSIGFPGAGITAVEYPMAFQKDAFYGVLIGVTAADARRLISGRDARSYPVPPSVQTTPADSLWIVWGAKQRDCWDCLH